MNLDRHWPMGSSPLRSRGRLLLAAVALALVLAGCSKGTYAVELFPEMHYNQSTKIQEPPRLAPPDGAVPITGREVLLGFDASRDLANPNSRQVNDRGAELFRVNCAMCHGRDGRGDGPVGAFLAAGGAPPADLPVAIKVRTDGEVFSLISNGGVRGTFALQDAVMPTFSLLLDSEDRWAVVHHLRALAAQQGQ